MKAVPAADINQPKSKQTNAGKGTGRGGARKNAGRKPGSATVRTREIADRAAASGITPLEVMLRAMGALVEQADAYPVVGGACEERLKLLIAAAGVAKDAAPYMHPRLQGIEYVGKVGIETLSDDNLRRRLARLGIAVHIPTAIVV